MAKDTCTLIINGKAHKARLGDTLIDAGLDNRIVLPHDCCSGQCETCRVRVVSGAIDDAGTREKDTVLSCLATVEGDAEISYDPVPIVRNTAGRVEDIEEISPDLLQVRVRTSRPVPWLPGQYVRMRFKGYPARDYSPTFGLDRSTEQDLLTFQIKVYQNSRVSSALGHAIDRDHKVSVKGPYGYAFLRRQPGRIILVSTGTGFAPLWSIAVAAAMRRGDQTVRMIAGCRHARDLYMRDAVTWLRDQGVPVTLTASDGDDETVMTARPQDLLPDLSESDMVYAAGSPSMVDAVRVRALAQDATFFADPFYAADPGFSLLDRILPRKRRHADPVA